MVQIDGGALVALNSIARDVREVFEERGYSIATALSQDRAFLRSKRPKSSMMRELIADGVEVGSARAGVWCAPGPGGSQELHLEIQGRPVVLRLKTAKRLASGDYRIVTNNVSNWGDFDEQSLVYEEPWVFAYTREKDGLGEIFAAKVIDISEGTPGILVLGAPTMLGERSTPIVGFVPKDEELEGFERDEDRDSDVGN